jgi:hypothetical protein
MSTGQGEEGRERGGDVERGRGGEGARGESSLKQREGSVVMTALKVTKRIVVVGEVSPEAEEKYKKMQ